MCVCTHEFPPDNSGYRLDATYYLIYQHVVAMFDSVHGGHRVQRTLSYVPNQCYRVEIGSMNILLLTSTAVIKTGLYLRRSCGRPPNIGVPCVWLS